MTVDEILAASRRIKYKPRVGVFVSRALVNPEWLDFQIVYETNDSHHMGQTKITHRHVIDKRLMEYFADDNHFFHWVRERIHQAETHEADEFFKVDGFVFIDPHAKDGT